MQAARNDVDGFMVVGRLLSPFHVKPHVIVDELRATTWKRQGVVTVEEVSSDDGRRDGFIFAEFDDKGDPAEVALGVMAIWAHVRGLPFKLKTESMGWTLGDQMGEVLEGQGASKRPLKFGSLSRAEKFPSASIDSNNTDGIVIKVATVVARHSVRRTDCWCRLRPLDSAQEGRGLVDMGFPGYQEDLGKLQLVQSSEVPTAVVETSNQLQFQPSILEALSGVMVARLASARDDKANDGTFFTFSAAKDTMQGPARLASAGDDKANDGTCFTFSGAKNTMQGLHKKERKEGQEK
ncbi:Isopenicillin N epimerase [Hordeum vulgare]|nr:Isopenicillin N epimerase [Hordeum vulgare]